MINLRPISDRTAITISIACTLHCLMLPLILAWLPTFASGLESEAFHLSLLALIIPISAFALVVGCKEHKRQRVLAMGGMGLVLLVSAVFVEDYSWGELAEKILTVSGSLLITVAHILNFRLCKQHANDCECSSGN